MEMYLKHFPLEFHTNAVVIGGLGGGGGQIAECLTSYTPAWTPCWAGGTGGRPACWVLELTGDGEVVKRSAQDPVMFRERAVEVISESQTRRERDFRSETKRRRRGKKRKRKIQRQGGRVANLYQFERGDIVLREVDWPVTCHWLDRRRHRLRSTVSYVQQSVSK